MERKILFKKRTPTHIQLNPADVSVRSTLLTRHKNSVGRPTKYDPSLCDRVIELGRQGYTKEEMALELGLEKKTLYNWCAKHSEFLHAIEEAVFLGQGYMEKLAREALSKPANAFNTALWSKIVSCRFPHVYRDTTRNEHSGPDKTPIPVAVASVEMTGENLAQWYKQFMDKATRPKNATH